MKLRAFTLTTVTLLLAAAALVQGCRIFSFSGCTRDGFAPGATVMVSELIFHTGCQTLRCPREISYDVRADSNGRISYNRDEDGNCWPNSTKLSFRTIRIPLPTFSNLSGDVNLNSPPSSITIGGWGMDATYGMPSMHLFDYNGTFVGAATAQAVGPDGSWAQFNVPALPNPYSGTYHAKIAVMRWDGIYDEVGDAPINCYGLPLVDADGDGTYSDLDCNDDDPYIYPLAPPDCSGLYWDANCNGQGDMYEYACQSGGGGECCGPGCYCY
ncbi:MAG: putative metal-binding motif-containing protein [Acidobacteria bacterium]|nr:putative metal-binding motif-containing protein [Acidobacteriota bacterium]